jgi:DNA-binding MurR/RpiR family transcriptional regulator
VAIPLSRHRLMTSVRSRMDQLPEAQRQVAAYLIGQPSQVPFMTTSELAQAAGTSQASVTRFVSNLGYENYAEFNRALSQMLLVELNQASPVRVEDEWGQDLGHILENEIAHLHSLTQVASSALFKRYAQRLAQAKQVLIAGFALAAPVAQHTGLFLHRQRPGVTTLTGLEAPSLMTLLHLQPGDFALLYALSRYPKETLRLAKIVQDSGAEIGLVTDRVGSKINTMVGQALNVPLTHGLTTAFTAAPLTLSGLLVDAASRFNRERTQQTLQRFEGLVEQLDYFAEKGKPPWKLENGHTPRKSGGRS